MVRLFCWQTKVKFWYHSAKVKANKKKTKKNTKRKKNKWIACIRKFQTKIKGWTRLETDENQIKICDSSNINQTNTEQN